MGKCKEGLKAIEYSYYANRTGYEPEISRFPCAFTGPCPSIIRISCGNGICETRIIEGNAIIGENYNNCPEDCVKPEMIKCKENDECGQNWCGQERNTCHQWSQVCNETGYCNKVHKEYSTYSYVDNKCIKN